VHHGQQQQQQQQQQLNPNVFRKLFFMWKSSYQPQARNSRSSISDLKQANKIMRSLSSSSSYRSSSSNNNQNNNNTTTPCSSSCSLSPTKRRLEKRSLNKLSTSSLLIDNFIQEESFLKLHTDEKLPQAQFTKSKSVVGSGRKKQLFTLNAARNLIKFFSRSNTNTNGGISSSSSGNSSSKASKENLNHSVASSESSEPAKQASSGKETEYISKKLVRLIVKSQHGNKKSSATTAATGNQRVPFVAAEATNGAKSQGKQFQSIQVSFVKMLIYLTWALYMKNDVRERYTSFFFFI
jgi:hypothetical protein